MIFDDSPIEKRGKNIEGVTKIHNHVSGRFILGFKILVCGYWDGLNVIPIDFSLHRERGRELDKAVKKLSRARSKVKKARLAYDEHKIRHNKARINLIS